ncbi:MAG: response regulator [Proteobacteria bacterium]|nr:response regulator [Pseudomonadota bacterium]
MKKILIAEDDLVFLNFILKALKSYENVFHVVTAGNGKIARDILLNEDIDLLLTDIMMPEMDGLALLSFVNDRNFSIPCFVMSAFGTPEIKQLIPKDVLHFFSKPFPVDKLGPSIVEALEEGVPSGVISGISVASFLLLVEMEKKTCLFEINLQDEEKGLCYFNKGVLFNAAFEGLRGEEAALSLLQHEKARFAFKPLPDHKLGKLIDKDLGTLIQEARREPQAEAPADDLEATIELVYDDVISVDDIIKEENTPPPAPELRLDLDGVYQDPVRQTGGRMTVVDMCPSHVIFLIPEISDLASGHELRLEFTLDDKPRSRVNKDVTVVEINDRYVRCKFATAYHYDRLGPYLHFNFLDKRQI